MSMHSHLLNSFSLQKPQLGSKEALGPANGLCLAVLFTGLTTVFDWAAEKVHPAI